MSRIALGIEYQGTRYCGWQKQSHCEAVQNVLELALSTVADHTVALNCAGRTDTGVHAIGQVVHFESDAQRPSRAWVQGVNTQLPGDIRVRWAQEMPDDFHARFSAVARQYRYVIFNRDVHSAVLANRVTWEPWVLDEDMMNEAAQKLIGEHDFSSFRASSCQASHANREVQSISVSRQGDFVFVDIQANAFLHHMVRNIVGALMKVGRGQADTDWLLTLLKLKDRTQGAVTAPADGLYFVNALYPDAYGIQQTPLDAILWQFTS